MTTALSARVEVQSAVAPGTALEQGRPWRSTLGRAWALLTSAKLAIALLVGVLAACVVGVTVYREAKAFELIFSTRWFNAMLSLLALSSGLTFFSRIWQRKLTLVSVGMILFHLSFMAVLFGIVFNSLYSFKGTIRLTEGETLPNGSPESYDTVEHGRLFDFQSLPGETTLVKMHRGFSVGGQDKRAAYEVAVGEGERKTQEIIYITKHLDHRGVRYFNEKEGYSVLITLQDQAGNELYGAHVPLQSLRQEDGRYLYATGSKTESGAFSFPPPPLPAVMDLQLVYLPDPVAERAGEVMFQTWLRPEASTPGAETRPLEGAAKVGESFRAGGFVLSAKEVRYWVGMTVRYDPGQTFVLASLSAGLFGMLLTFVGRIRQDAAKRKRSAELRAASARAPAVSPVTEKVSS